MDKAKAGNHLYIGPCKYLSEHLKSSHEQSARNLPYTNIKKLLCSPHRPLYHLPSHSRQPLSNALYTTMRHKSKHRREYTNPSIRKNTIPFQHLPTSSNNTPTKGQYQDTKKELIAVYATAKRKAQNDYSLKKEERSISSTGFHFPKENTDKKHVAPAENQKPSRSKTPLPFQDGLHILKPKTSRGLPPLNYIGLKNNVAASHPAAVNPVATKDSFETIEDIVEAYAARSRKGKHQDQAKMNQDSYFAIRNFTSQKNVWLFGVCDGHGTNGHLVSKFLKTSLPENIVAANLGGDSMWGRRLSEPIQKQSKGILSDSSASRIQVIKDGFARTSQSLQKQHLDINYSGSTVISVLLIGRKLACANLGDSRAVLASFRKKGLSRSWVATPLSRDHKPTLPDENKRILRHNGRIEPFTDNNGNPIGPARVWRRDADVPGLAMSRSMGDRVAAECGVSSEPEISEKTLSGEDKYLIIASDGVWEFLKNTEVVEMVIPFWMKKDVEGACDKIVTEAVKRWEENEKGVIDDITCIVVFINTELEVTNLG